MLTNLRVSNFVLIEQLDLELGPGLTVITGETGAGKSILISAIGLVLGGRAQGDTVREGAQSAEVEARFELPAESPALALLAEAGVDTEAGEVLLRRVVSKTGRSRAYLNGRMCTRGQLGDLAPYLVDVASQHESVRLTDARTHLGYLDAFARLDKDAESLAKKVQVLQGLHKGRAELLANAAELAEREGFLRFQLSQIDEVDPQPEEMEALQAERSKLRHATRLLAAVRQAVSGLEADGSGVVDQLGEVAGEVSAASEMDLTLAPAADALSAAQSEIQEVALRLRDYLGELSVDPARLEGVEERLFELEKLARAHGGDLAAVFAARERLSKELSDVDQGESKLAQLEEAIAKELEVAGKGAEALSKKRKSAAKKLAKAITQELSSLGMGRATIDVSIERHKPTASDSLVWKGARLASDGLDQVEFLIAPNTGMPPKPLRKVASGGELSRALLALKRVLAQLSPTGTYVFDEVDTGVGGAVAEHIGKALADVARHRQVLCITHLAPIAAYGTGHLVVQKFDKAGRTQSSLQPLAEAERTQEIARMLSGEKVSRAALDTAVQMLAAGAAFQHASG